MTQSSDRPPLAKFHELFLGVSMYLAYGYLFYALIDQALPIRIGFSTISVNPIALIAPYLFSWVTSRLTTLVLAGSSQIPSFFGSAVNFFIVAFVNTCAVFGLFPLDQIGPGGSLQLAGSSGVEALKYVFGPMLLYGGFFLNWVLGNFLFARRDQILIGGQPAHLGWVLAVKLFSGVMFLASFLPVLWIGIGYVQRLFR